MIDQRPAERFLSDDLDFVVLNPARHLDFDYELRHPGHGDQSVHNPHKHGGNGAAVASDLAAGRDVVVAGRDLPGAFDAMANGDGGVNLNRLSTTDGVSFAATGVKVPRSEMPQVPGSKKAEFIAELDGKGVKSTRESVDPKSLKPIQSEISGQKSGQMLQSMREGKLLEGDNPLIVSRDGFVVDGHHRWAAAVARSYEVPVALPVLRIDMDAAQLLGEVKAFSEAQSIPARVFDRAVDFHYELRHPGHGDQSVHNPHKGGGAAGAGAFVPGKWEQQPQVTKEEHEAKIKANYMKLAEGKTLTPEQQAMMERNAQELADLTYQSEISHIRYTNGPVTLSVDKNAAAPLTPEIQARMDAVIADTQAKYPGKMIYEWTNLEGRESNATGATRLSSRAIAFDSAKMTKYKDAKYGLEHTVWHETGHAIPMKGFETDTFTLPSEVEGLIDSYSAKVASKFPREFSVGYISDGPSGNLATMISQYAATKGKVEMHAEIFALFHNPLAQMPDFQAKVVKEYGKAAGWKP